MFLTEKAIDTQVCYLVTRFTYKIIHVLKMFLSKAHQIPLQKAQRNFPKTFPLLTQVSSNLFKRD